MAEIAEALKIYKDYGIAGLFLVLYLTTVWKFHETLKSNKTEMVMMVERVIHVADTSSAAIAASNETMSEVKSGMDQLVRQNGEFLSYLKGRDEQNLRGRK